MTADILAAPMCRRIPGCDFRRGDLVAVDGAGPMRFLDLVNPAAGEPIAKLGRRRDGSATFVRIGRVTLWDEVMR